MEEKVKLLVSHLGENRVKTNVNLNGYLQTELGGVAAVFYIATTTRELTLAIELCKELKIEFLIIGGGSKIAISKDGFGGLAIKNRSDNIKIFGIKGKVSRTGIGIDEAFLEADSGVSLTKLSEFAHMQGLGGFEVLKSSIGTIGGSYYLNPVLREKTSQIKVLSVSSGTRTKTINQIKKGDVILSVVFKLQAQRV